jgi:hypothetical protein
VRENAADKVALPPWLETLKGSDFLDLFHQEKYDFFFLKTYGIISLKSAAFFDFVALQTFC